MIGPLVDDVCKPSESISYRQFENSIQLFEGPKVSVGTASWGVRGLGLGGNLLPLLLGFDLLGGDILMKVTNRFLLSI